MNLTESFAEWLKTFETGGSARFSCTQQLCDGVVVANILRQILPEFVDREWLSRIDADRTDDWRVRETNLRKVCEKIIDYYRECLNKSIPETLIPSVTRIATFFDDEQLGLLLQLVLGCAINGPNIGYFVDIMNRLPDEVQEGLKTGIQILDYNNLFDLQHKVCIGQETAGRRSDAAQHLARDLREAVRDLTAERDKLVKKVNKYKARLMAGEAQADSDRKTVAKLRENIEQLKDEAIGAEESVERARAKCSLLEAEVKALRAENGELKYSRQAADDETDRVKYLEEELFRAKQITQLQANKYKDLKTRYARLKEAENRADGEIGGGALAKARAEIARLRKQVQECRLRVEEESLRADRADDVCRAAGERCERLTAETRRYANAIRTIQQEINRYIDHKTLTFSGDQSDVRFLQQLLYRQRHKSADESATVLTTTPRREASDNVIRITLSKTSAEKSPNESALVVRRPEALTDPKGRPRSSFVVSYI